MQTTSLTFAATIWAIITFGSSFIVSMNLTFRPKTFWSEPRDIVLMSITGLATIIFILNFRNLLTLPQPFHENALAAIGVPSLFCSFIGGIIGFTLRTASGKSLEDFWDNPQSFSARLTSGTFKNLKFNEELRSLCKTPIATISLVYMGVLTAFSGIFLENTVGILHQRMVYTSFFMVLSGVIAGIFIALMDQFMYAMGGRKMNWLPWSTFKVGSALLIAVIFIDVFSFPHALMTYVGILTLTSLMIGQHCYLHWHTVWYKPTPYLILAKEDMSEKEVSEETEQLPPKEGPVENMA